MKCLDPDSLAQLERCRLEKETVFSFRCHPELDCFNRCCRNLNLFLYPYDVLRLKRNLGISSGQFLDRHVDVVLRPGHFFPEVLLTMSASTERTCPFLTDAGCSVYADRPDTCRSFPIEQGRLLGENPTRDESVFFFRPPDFCLGQNESTQWTVPEWLQDQKADKHQEWTVRWAMIRALFDKNPWGAEGPQGPRARMAFMAAYNIDSFREFVFGSSFLKRYHVPLKIRKKIRVKEAALLRFAFDWIRLFVWNLPSERIQPKR